MFRSGLKNNKFNGNRGSQGVGIILNKHGVIAKKTAGSESHVDLGAQFMALRLLFRDSQHRDVGVFLIPAYAPVDKVPENE